MGVNRHDRVARHGLASPSLAIILLRGHAGGAALPSRHGGRTHVCVRLAMLRQVMVLEQEVIGVAAQARQPSGWWLPVAFIDDADPEHFAELAHARAAAVSTVRKFSAGGSRAAAGTVTPPAAARHLRQAVPMRDASVTQRQWSWKGGAWVQW